MNSADKKQPEKEDLPPRASEFERMLAAYIADLRAILEKLRRKLN
jgi:hypothetical protein